METERSHEKASKLYKHWRFYIFFRHSLRQAMPWLDFIYGSVVAGAGKNATNQAGNCEELRAPTVETCSPVPSSRFSSSADASEPSHVNPSPAAASKELPSTTSEGAKRAPVRGFSLHSLAFLSNRDEVKPALSTVREHKKEAKASAAFFRRQAKLPSADKRAKESALIVRSLIVGQASIYPASSKASTGVSKPQFSQIKSQLMQPKSANKVIAQLRSLPASDKIVVGGDENKPAGPVHAVCLDTTDAEAEKRYFSSLTKGDDVEVLADESTSSPSVADASIGKLASMFKDMRIVSLIIGPDFGLGQPGDGNGILSGAVPTAKTIINGFEQITPQLMALGLATGQAFLPDHTGRRRI
jgi:hypothetical protein